MIVWNFWFSISAPVLRYHFVALYPGSFTVIGLKEFSKGNNELFVNRGSILMKSQKSTTTAYAVQLAFSEGTQVNAIDVDAVLFLSANGTTLQALRGTEVWRLELE